MTKVAGIQLLPNAFSQCVISVKQVTLLLLVLSGQLFLVTGNSNSPKEAILDNNNDSWISLWPKSLLHAKLLQSNSGSNFPPSKRPNVTWKQQHSFFFMDLNFTADNLLKSLFADNCSLYFTDLTSDHDVIPPGIQVQVTGGSNCRQIPFQVLSKDERDNLTHLVINGTGIQVLPRQVFHLARLRHLYRLDIIGNNDLTTISGRAFEGLSGLSYLSLINNTALSHLGFDSFSGLKNVQELIFVGNSINGTKLFTKILQSASMRILPNLVHLHICSNSKKVPGRKVANVTTINSRVNDTLGSSHSQVSAPLKSVMEKLFPRTPREPLGNKGHDDAINNSSGNHSLTIHGHDLMQLRRNISSGIEHTPESRRAKLSLTIVSIVAIVLLLFATIILIIAFIYYSTLKNIITMVEDDFLHNYEYDAFVSYNVNDSDWVFRELIPNLEEDDSQTIGEQAGCSGEEKEEITKNSFQRIKLCVYDRDFIAGRAISECIVESIKNSRKVILVISNSFVHSPWCRFETDLAHNTLMDQNREGLILVKLEDIPLDRLESFAPQLHFLLKTRIYLDWNHNYGEKEKFIFFKKLRRSLGFTNYSPYDAVKQYYQNHCFRTSRRSMKSTKNTTPPISFSQVSSPHGSRKKKLIEDRDRFVPQLKITCVQKDGHEFDDDDDMTFRDMNGNIGYEQLVLDTETKQMIVCMKDMSKSVTDDETMSKSSCQTDSAIDTCDRMSSDDEAGFVSSVSKNSSSRNYRQIGFIMTEKLLNDFVTFQPLDDITAAWYE